MDDAPHPAIIAFRACLAFRLTITIVSRRAVFVGSLKVPAGTTIYVTRGLKRLVNINGHPYINNVAYIGENAPQPMVQGVKLEMVVLIFSIIRSSISQIPSVVGH